MVSIPPEVKSFENVGFVMIWAGVDGFSIDFEFHFFRRFVVLRASTRKSIVARKIKRECGRFFSDKGAF